MKREMIEEEDTEASLPMSARRRQNRRKHYIYEFMSVLLYVALIYICCLLLVCYVGQRSVVEGSSMYPTLEDGDNLLIDKISYRFQEPERFDIIVFRYPHAQDTYYIKRIIGLPGETVLIQDGQIYINGELLEDPYGAEPMENPGRAYRQITLGPGEYFVLGDNRNVSSDSRDSSVGNVTTEQIVGKVFLRIYPWKQMGKVE